eukprot:jgi/Phyca11/96386/e_gw1.1.184.1
MSWWEHVVPLLEYYTERTPGAYIERKESSVAWHYRDCDLDHGLWQASELLVSLREITRSLPVSVCPGNRYLEVRPQKVSKATLFERIWDFNMEPGALDGTDDKQPVDFVLVIASGDDRTDEDLFAQTTSVSTDEAEDGRYRFPVNTFVCTLGRKLSQAPYYIKNSGDLFQLLQEMGMSSHIRKQRMLSMGSVGDI